MTFREKDNPAGQGINQANERRENMCETLKDDARRKETDQVFEQ